MSAERYLNHPNFGLLYRVCPAGEHQEVYATLYAQRMFFRVTHQARGASFDSIPLLDARFLAEQNLMRERRQQSVDLAMWQKLFDLTFI
ncbi:MAG: PipX family protein [Synechococcus lacustris]